MAQPVPITHSLFTTNADPTLGPDGTSTQIGSGYQANGTGGFSTSVGRNSQAIATSVGVGDHAIGQTNAVAMGSGAEAHNGGISIGRLAFMADFGKPNNNVFLGWNFGTFLGLTNVVNIAAPTTNDGTFATFLQLKNDNTFSWGGIPLFTNSGGSVQLTPSIGVNAISSAGGVTNNGSAYNLSGTFNGTYLSGSPDRWLGFGDSLSQNLLSNGWLSQGGYSNQWSTGGSTNGYLYYNVGSYTANGPTYIDVFTNITASQLGVYSTVDTAGAVPGQRGSDIWGRYNGSNYISMTSLEANLNTDQTHGFTYSGAGTSSQVVHGDPLPLTFWPDSTNDVYFTVQGTSYTNFNNTPISFTVTGSSYVSIVFNGTPSYTTTASISRPYKAGEGAVTKYAPPYTSACDGFNFSGGNIPAGLWADSNAPSITGKKTGAIMLWGNNDVVALTTNSTALWSNQCLFAQHLHSIGIYPVLLVQSYTSPQLNASRGITMTNLGNLQFSNWPAYFDGFYPWQVTNNALGKSQQSTNYIDGTHPTTLYHGQNATNIVKALGYDKLPAKPLAAGMGGKFDGSAITNLAQNAFTYTNFLIGSLFTNTTTRNILVVGNARCNPTTTLAALLGLSTSPNGSTYTTSSIVGMEADTIYTTAPHEWFQISAQIQPGGIWKFVDITGAGVITMTNSYYQVLQ